MAEKKEGEHKRKHLHEIRTKAVGDGTYVHHHTYKAHKDDLHTEPERENVATSSTPEEAGEHVSEQMGMNDQAQSDPGAPAPDAGAGGAAPDAGGAAPGGM